MDDIVQIPVRVLNETDQAWLMAAAPFRRSSAYWEPKAKVTIPDRNEIKPTLTACMTRDYATSRGWLK